MASMGEERGAYRVLVGKLEGRNHWGDLGVDGWIILGWISRMWVCGLDWAGSGQGQVADACECGNEPSGSIKMWGIF